MPALRPPSSRHIARRHAHLRRADARKRPATLLRRRTAPPAIRAPQAQRFAYPAVWQYSLSSEFCRNGSLFRNCGQSERHSTSMVFQHFAETGIPVKWKPATLKGGGALSVWQPLPKNVSKNSARTKPSSRNGTSIPSGPCNPTASIPVPSS